MGRKYTLLLMVTFYCFQQYFLVAGRFKLFQKNFQKSLKLVLDDQYNLLA